MILADPHLSLDGALHQENILPGRLNLNFYSLLSENKLYTQLKADFQSVLRTLESLFTTFVLFHVRRHKM